MAAPLPAPEPIEEGPDVAPAPARTRTVRGLVSGKSAIAPHARRLNDQIRAVPPLAKAQDKVAATWARLVEAFCQAIEPLLERRFPDLRLVAVADGAAGVGVPGPSS